MLTAVVSHHLTKEESGYFCSICRILARDSMRHSRKLPPLFALEPSWANQAQNHGYLRGLAVVLAYTNRHSTAFPFAVLHTRHLCTNLSTSRLDLGQYKLSFKRAKLLSRPTLPIRELLQQPLPQRASRYA
uniref:Uncharacterized protein n=1 Tax=Nelumbo nucifera TaxID=4432 RepID=A0A822XVC5_NELNU|nr:TPA_asm: hypothetical protein HUJ06_027048 [Nelumbo nucifera]